MTSFASLSNLRWLCAAGALALASACGSGGNSGNEQPDATGTAGTSDAAGSTDGAGDAASPTGAAGTSGAAGTGAAGTGAAGTGAAGTGYADGGLLSDSANRDGGPGFGGVAGLEDLSTVKASSGCGKDPGQPLGSWQLAPAGTNKYMYGYALSTPDTPKGSLTRRYFVKLPATYDKTKPYRVVYEAPAYGGVGYDVPAFDTVASMPAAPAAAADVHGAGVIQVGLTPDPTAAAGCFDDQSGADTIEKSFIETLAPVIASSFCIDQHRVFLAGHDSGGWLTNHLGHVYGSRIFRAISPSAGGLPTDGTQPCLTAGLPGSATTVGGCLPVPGIWWHDMSDIANPYTGTQHAIEAALVANHCANATFAAGPKKSYATLAHATCLAYSTCPPEFPVVLCTSQDQSHSSQFAQSENLAATWAFFASF